MSDTRTPQDGELLAQFLRGVRLLDLGRPYEKGMAQSPNHPAYTHTLARRHGDIVRVDGGSAASDLITLGTHVGTHIDALAHVSHRGKLFGDLDADEEQIGGKFMNGGIHDVEPIFSRAVLLDIPRVHGWAICPPGYEIGVKDLEAAAINQNVAIKKGDVVLIRSGWGRNWKDRTTYIGEKTGVPGVGVEGANWLAGHCIRAVGADTIAFEHIPPGSGHSQLPVHRILLVEHGINIIETMNLEPLAIDQQNEFVLIAIPLNLVGATGSPVRPLALVEL